MMLKFSFILLAILQSSLAFDLGVYKQQYQTQVGVPYKNAVTVAATNILEYLANAPVPTTAADGQQVVANINAQVQSFSGNLNTADQSSNALRQQLDREVEQLTAQASGVQQQIAANELQLQQTDAQIQQTNAQIGDAQNQVNAAGKSVQDAQNALESEQRRVKKAEKCIKIGGWLGKKICKVINHDGIKHAEQARNRAQTDLAGRQQRLAQFRNQLAQFQQQQAQLQSNKANLEANKGQLNGQLTQLTQARDNVNNVDTSLKSVIAHVETLLGKGQVLADVVKKLIDMETVIGPLNAIADQIMGYSNPDDVNYLNTMKQKINAALPVIQQKLPQYALIPPVA